MNHARTVLWVITLLAASLLANVFLLLRISRNQPAMPAATTPMKDGPSPTTLEESLRQEQAKNQELSKTIEMLQQDKRLLIEDPSPKPPDQLAEIRKKLRKVFKSYDPRAQLPTDPDVVHELNQMAGEIRHFGATRLRDPKAYGDFLSTFYEVALEGEGTSLTAAQSAQIREALDGLTSALSQLSSLPAAERQIRELELDASTFSRIASIMTEAQKAVVREAPMSQTILLGNFMPNMFTRKDAQGIIASSWRQAYRLDGAQQSLAMAAAQLFISAVSQYESTSRTGASTVLRDMTSPEAYRYRIHCLRAQSGALKTIEASMTPAQLDHLRKVGLQEYFFSDREEGGQLVPEEDK